VNSRQRREKRIAAAEGYLTLDLPEQALSELDAVPDPQEAAYMVSFLRGMALRQLDRHEEAIEAFDVAAAINGKNIDLLLAQAWCFKRVGRLDRAIEVTEKAYQVSPKTALVLYNLACYLALAGRKNDALSWLGRALRVDASYARLIPDEHDFDSLRHDIDFRQLVELAEKPIAPRSK
jgi:tetratricopeptide (TPR) repeat protein